MFITNITSSPDYLWFIWPLIGWGFGLLGHAIGVFGLGGFLGKDWKEKNQTDYGEDGKGEERINPHSIYAGDNKKRTEEI